MKASGIVESYSSIESMSKRHKMFVAIACGIGLSLIFLESTIFPVALPTIQTALNLSPAAFRWAMNGYFLALASFVLACGQFSDTVGKKFFFLAGLILYLCTLIFGFFSVNACMLIVTRVFLGLSGAMVLPSSMAIVLDIFTKQERGKVIGTMVAVSSVFLSLGPVAGGVLTYFSSWRSCFLVSIPLLVVGIYFAFKYVPTFEKHKRSFDGIGFITYTCSLTCLIVGLMQSSEWGWDCPATNMVFAFALAFFLIHIYSNVINKDPFFDFSLLKISNFLGGNLCILCVQFLSTITVFIAIFFQQTFRYNPMESGLICLLTTLPVLLGAPLSGYLTDKFDSYWPTQIGFLLLTSTLGLCYCNLYWSSMNVLVTTLLLYGFSLSLMTTPISLRTLNSIPPEKRGIASAMYTTTRHVASTFAVALLGAVIHKETQDYFFAHTSDIPVVNALKLRGAFDLFIEKRLEIQTLTEFGVDQIHAIDRVLYDASMQAFNKFFMICLGVSLLGTVICYLFFREKRNSVVAESSL